MLVRNRNGFSLVEVAVVLVIGGLLIAAFSAYVINFITTTRIKNTQSRIEQVVETLNLYAHTNNRLPCVASRAEPIDTALYAHMTDCTAPAAAGTARVAYGTRQIRIGMVPTRDLNLPDEYGYDAWGSRLVYAVTENQTASFDPMLGGIGLVDSNGNSIVAPPDSATFVVLSVGADRKGGYTASGGLTESCVGAVGLDAENCDDNGVFRQTVITSTRAGANFYDDYLAYGARVTGPVSSCTGGINNITYTDFSSSGTWTKPPSLQFIELQVVGAGGGGGACWASATGPTDGNCTLQCTAGNGGSGGYIYRSMKAQDLPDSVAVTVAPGGAAGQIPYVAQQNGVDAGVTRFGNIAVVQGGRGGTRAVKVGTARWQGTNGASVPPTTYVPYGGGGGAGGQGAYGTDSAGSGTHSKPQCEVRKAGNPGMPGRVIIKAYMCE